MKFRTPHICLLLTTLLFGISASAQEIKKNDSIRRHVIPENPIHRNTLKQDPSSLKTSSAIFEKGLKHQLPTQYRVQSYSDIFPKTGSLPSNVSISGYGSDFYNNVERTAVFSVTPASNLLLYSAATLGVYKTLPFGNINYYNINLGAAFAINSSLDGNAGVFYRSNLGIPLPMMGAYLNMNYRATNQLQLKGGVSYNNLQSPQFNLSQQSLMINAQARYQIAEDWFLNGYGGMPVYHNAGSPNMLMHPMMPRLYYGGTVEYWFQPQIGIEGGVIWQQDMFGKLRPMPKFELKFGDRRK